MAQYDEPADFSVQDSEEYVEALWRNAVKEELVARKPAKQARASKAQKIQRRPSEGGER